MNVKIIYYCYIIYLIFHFVLLSCDILTRYQILQTLMNTFAVYKKQGKKRAEAKSWWISPLPLLSHQKMLTKMSNAYDYSLEGKGLLHSLKQFMSSFPSWLKWSFSYFKGNMLGLLLWFTVGVLFTAEEPVSMHVGWTNIYTLLVEGMKVATCPAWSAITWIQMNGVTCPLCLSLWQLTQEQCTMGKYTFQASHSSTFCHKAQFQGTCLTYMYMFNSQGVYTMENMSHGCIAMTLLWMSGLENKIWTQNAQSTLWL